MLTYVLIVAIAYGIAYGITSTGLQFWRAIAGFGLAFVVAWFGGSVLGTFLITWMKWGDANSLLPIIGQGFWWALLGAGVGVYRARYKLRTGEIAPPLSIPKWVAITTLGLFLIGILAAVALPAYQDHTKLKRTAVTQPKSASSTDVAVDWDKGVITPPSNQPISQAERGPWEQYQYQDGVAASKRGDFASAAVIFHPLAEAGHPKAQASLGSMYQFGNGVPKDFVAAARWYRLAANQGNAVAQTQLGMMYESGEGVPQDYSEAVKLHRMAATQGDYLGQNQLGIAYALGRGVPQDNVMAHMWFNLAGASGASSASGSRDTVAASMSSEQISQAQQMARNCKQRNFQSCD